LLLPPVTRHRPGITNPKRLGALLRAIDGYTRSEKIAIALKLTPLLFVRPGELRGAEWDEIDFERAQWRIPAERMKMRTPHIVPLCRQALELLAKLHALTGDGRYLFPAYGKPDRIMSGTRLAAALASLGFSSREVTPHGFRATACTLLNELGWRADAIERQLAHAVGDSARRLYNHAQYLPSARR
jgi:integrase